MMRGAEEEWRRIVEVPIKLRMALGFVPALPERMTRALEEWMAGAALSAEQAKRLEPRFGFGIDAALSAITLRTSVKTAADEGRLVSRLEAVAGDEELARIEASLERLAPERVGDFIEARSDALDRGWFFSMEAPLVRALAVVEPTRVVERLLDFAEEQELGVCTRIARSLGAGNPFTELVIPLAGRDARAALEVGIAAHDALGIAPPGAALEAALARIEHELALTVWLTRGGLSKLGLSARGPDTIQTLRLCAAAGHGAMDPLAAVEGALGVERPETIECAVTAGGPRVQMEYEIGR